MRILTLIAAAVAVMALSSCSSSKNAAQSDYQYQQWLAQQNQQQYQQNQQSQSYAPREVERQLDKCVVMALDQSATNLRAYGDARGFNESAIRDLAVMTAQERMANSIKTSVATVAEKYTRTASKNVDASTEDIFEQLSKRVSDATMTTRVINQSIYDTQNGQVHIYVCIEMNASKEDLCEKAVNVLSEGGIAGIQEHKNQFKQEMLSELNKSVGGQ